MSFSFYPNKKSRPLGQLFLAGGVGIEPTLTVLETAVLPLYEPPSSEKLFSTQFFCNSGNPTYKEKLRLLSLFVFGSFLAPLAKLLNYQTVRIQFFIFLGLVVYVVTNCTFQVDEIIL